MAEWHVATTSACARWAGGVEASRLSPGTRARYVQVFDSFGRYASSAGVSAPGLVTPALCARFLVAPLQGDRRPSSATSRLRLTVIRSAFDALVDRGLLDCNPTVGLLVAHAPTRSLPCPLTPPEVQRLLVAGRVHPDDTLRPATSALALCGATHAEIAAAAVADVDLDRQRLRLGPAPRERYSPLTPGVTAVLVARIRTQERAWRRQNEVYDPALVPLALNRPAGSYPLNCVAPTISGNLSRALRCAGVTRPGVRPRSIREYAANTLYAVTGRVEAVAERLGITSLDAAARLLDPTWQQQWGQTVRDGSTDDD